MTMVLSRSLPIILSVASIPGSTAFSSTAGSSKIFRPYASLKSELHVGIAWEDYDDVTSSDFMMLRAEACANSELCPLEEAQVCLDEILHIQKQCVGSGVLSTSAICQNVDVTADIVSKLRQKIEVESRRLAPIRAGLNLVNLLLGFTIANMVLHGIAADPNVPVDSMAGISALPITFQEWVWAVRDGYFSLLFSEWFRHGGLLADVSTFDMKAVPLAPQEWVWAIQNGGFGRMLQENIRYGGLLADSSFETETVPLTVQEGLWALTGGYGGTAWDHFFRNGGL
jgi:hypothetical protein